MNKVPLPGVTADRLSGEAVVVPFFSDERPPSGTTGLLDWRLNGMLTSMLRRGSVAGSFGEHLLVRSNGKVAADWVLFVGGGERRGLDLDRLRWLMRHALETCQRAGFTRIVLGVDSTEGVDPVDLAALAGRVLEDLGLDVECKIGLPLVAGATRLP